LEQLVASRADLDVVIADLCYGRPIARPELVK